MVTFDSHPKSKFLSSKNTINPNEVALNSHKKFWFDCGKCEHEFEISLNNISNLNRWCSYCANKRLCDLNRNCSLCHDKCFASIEYSKNWSALNNEEPFELLKNSHKEYWFDCPICKHTFKQKLSHITRGNKCPYCASKLLCNEITKCNKCYKKTFASIERSKNWSCKNKKKPIEVFKSSSEKFIFDCDKCSDDFESKLCHITDGSWCPNCRYKTEDIVYDKLKTNYPLIQRQYKVDWCKDKKHLPFDFVIKERKIIIEIDGEQHWKQVAKWKTPEHNKERDKYKMKCANDNGFSVIRILQEDVFKNKYYWLNELTNNIEKITNDNRVQNIYMCKNNEYKDFDIN